MQTFLPVADFTTSARILDWRRLGKQRVEAWMIHDLLTNPESRWRSWRHHPVIRMWHGHEDALSLYFWSMVEEWLRRRHSRIEAAIDGLADKLDRQVLKYKEQLKDHRTDSTAINRSAVGTDAEGSA